MKLLFNRISSRISGAEIYNLYLLEGLKKFKDLELVFSSDNKRLNERINHIGIKTIFIDPHIDEIGTKRQFLKALTLLPGYYFSYKKFFSSIKKFDFVIFESMTEKLLLTFILVVSGKNVVWIEHGPLYHTRRAKIVKILYWINAFFVKSIVCVSRATLKDLTSNGISTKKTVVIYIGVDMELFSPLSPDEMYKIRSKLKLVGKNIIGYLGTVTEEKGIKVFLEFAELYSKGKKNIIFLIVGNGDLLNWLKVEVKRRELSSKFYFADHVDEIRNLLGIMDILVFPTFHQEGFPLSLLEANAMGVPVVATDMGGNNEIIKSSINGVLYKDLSPNKIKKIVENVVLKRDKYSKEARNIVLKSFTLEECSKRFYTLFTNLYEK